MEVRPPAAGIRDPFAWREALSPGISPAPSARSGRTSRAGSRAGGSGASTPRSATPPLSPPGGNSARSSRSGLSARSGIGSARDSGASGASGHSPVGRGGYPSQAFPSDAYTYSARSSNSIYATPDPSARSSEFTSVYDASSSACASARTWATADMGSGGHTPPGRHEVGGDRRGGRAKHASAGFASDPFAAAASALGEGGGAAVGSSAPPAGASEPTLDPRQVFSAARHGRHKEVEASLQAGFDPLYADSFGNTLFHVACQNGNKRIAKAAIKYGGDMDAQNGKGNTGLHFLFAYGYPDIGEYFIEKGADETVPNESGKTAREGIR